VEVLPGAGRNTRRNRNKSYRQSRWPAPGVLSTVHDRSNNTKTRPRIEEEKSGEWKFEHGGRAKWENGKTSVEAQRPACVHQRKYGQEPDAAELNTVPGGEDPGKAVQLSWRPQESRSRADDKETGGAAPFRNGPGRSAKSRGPGRITGQNGQRGTSLGSNTTGETRRENAATRTNETRAQ